MILGCGPVGGVAAVDGEGDAEYEARCWAAQPQDGGGDLVAASEATDRLVGLGFCPVELAVSDHVGDHRRLDGAGADGIDADAARRVLQRGALGQAEDAVLGRVVGRATGIADKPAERRAVHDRAAALRAHLAQLVLHARPDAAQVDRGDAIEVLGRLVGRIGQTEHDAGVVEGHVEPTEGVHDAVDEAGDLVLVGHVAGDAERLMAGGGQLVGGSRERVLVDVGERDGGAGRGEGPRGVEPHTGTRAGDQCDLAVEVVRRVHSRGSTHGAPIAVSTACS
jgi:hypothetical protein